MTKKRKFIQTKKTAKAIYMVSGLGEMVTYLDAKEELGEITEKESNIILERVTDECANMTYGELEKIRKMF